MLGLPDGVTALLFDLDGVLTQTATAHAAAWKQTFDDYLRARGEPFLPFDLVADYTRYVDGKPRSAGVRSFLAARGIALPDGTEADPPSAETVHALGNRKNELLLQRLRQGPVATYAGSVRYVRAARAGGLKTAVVSSSKNTREVLLSAGIADLFDVRIDGIIAEQEHLTNKPAPDTYLAAARALAVAPDRAVVFEDALAGVEAGHVGQFGYGIAYEVEPLDGRADIVVQSELVANEPTLVRSDDPRVAAAIESPLTGEDHLSMGTRGLLVHRTRRSGLRIAAAMDHEVSGTDRLLTSTESSTDSARFVITEVLEQGQRLRVIKYVAYGWSETRTVPALRDQVAAALAAARRTGWGSSRSSGATSTSSGRAPTSRSRATPSCSKRSASPSRTCSRRARAPRSEASPPRG
ncbi:MAG: beta-phosphoglucomutase family hydrolase [Deltaproteobacteria bacterium]|nr:beta-phosphoglucomutase family hydrolase [Deltaproteobacteria bacterium]